MTQSKLSANTKVLIIDDMDTVRKSLKMVLSSLGYKNITEAEDGQAAFDLISSDAHAKEPFEVIFSDIKMPIMDGLEFLTKARQTELYKKTPIIMVTTVNETKVVIEAISLGASNYIIKPFNQKVVKQKIYETVFKKK